MREPVGEHHYQCPYCGEGESVVIDTSAADQAYVEDCEVCCRPIRVRVRASGGRLRGFGADAEG